MQNKNKNEIGIPAKFLLHLYEKPPMWWVFWWRAFADMSEHGGQITYSHTAICAWLGVGRTTLQRIVDFGSINYDGGQQVGSKWASGKLTISMLKDVDGQQTGSKRAELPAIPESKALEPKTRKTPSKVDAEMRRQNQGLFQQIISIYDYWIRETTGVPAKIDGAQGKAVKSIIQYLRIAVRGKDYGENDENQQIVKAFTFILANWHKLDDFNRKLVKLTQINSNIQTILMQLRAADKAPIDSRTTKFKDSLASYLKSL